MGNKSPTNQSLRPSYYSSPIVIPTSPMPVEGETTPLRDTALVESTGDSRSITMQRLPTLLSSESSEFSPKPPTAPKSPAMHRRQNVAGGKRLSLPAAYTAELTIRFIANQQCLNPFICIDHVLSFYLKTTYHTYMYVIS